MNTIELTQASILYLDDEEIHLKHTKDDFKNLGFEIETTNSIKEAEKKILENTIDIFICDQYMDHISPIRGYELLHKIREKNKVIFLALFTAYAKSLTKKEEEFLRKNEIEIYSKGDLDEMMLNLISDFKKFQEGKLKHTETRIGSPEDGEIIEILKDEIAASLKRISNQDLPLPIVGFGKMPVHQIAEEVKNLTPMGRRFIKDWLKSTTKYKK